MDSLAKIGQATGEYLEKLLEILSEHTPRRENPKSYFCAMMNRLWRVNALLAAIL